MGSVGDYEIESQIGAGTAGTVWKAFHRGPVTRTVALKRFHGMLSPADLEAIRWEVGVLTELDHPHIVRVLEVLDDGGGIAVAMQLAPGGSLAALLAERGRLTPGQAVAVTAPIGIALASAHRRGIMHSDVKPGNVLFTSDGEPLLSDFGVSRAFSRHAHQPVAGTPAYLAPELLVGAPAEPRSDVYSLGVTCYEVLTGRVPFHGATEMEVIAAADRGEYELLTDMPGIPQPLAEAVQRAMARDPGQRFASADEFAEALRAAVPGDQIRLPGVPTQVVAVEDSVGGGTTIFGPRPQDAVAPPPLPQKSSNKLLIGGLAALAVVVLAGVGFIVLDPLGDDDGDEEATDGTPVTIDEECPELTEPEELSPEAELLVGDPDGDGCETFGILEVRQLEGQQVLVLDIVVNGQDERLGLGEPGDQAFLGDWNCDGRDTAGVYRAQSGQLLYFNDWPRRGGGQISPEVREETHSGGLARVVPPAGAGDCDLIIVEPGDDDQVFGPDDEDGQGADGAEGGDG